MPGRRPKPSKLKKLAGNPGRRPLPKEPELALGVPTCPGWLSKEAKEEWKRIVPQLKKARLLVLIDRVALAAYCQAWAELAQATEMLDREGRIIEQPVVSSATGKKTGAVKKAHPAVKHQRDAFAQVKKFLIEFGLSPASRSKAAGGCEPEERSDPLAEFLKHGKARR
jgi:P27 family predicted phage terminase small subunit